MRRLLRNDLLQFEQEIDLHTVTAAEWAEEVEAATERKALKKQFEDNTGKLAI